MAAISSGVARPAVSSITETRYCISDHLLWFGALLMGGPSHLLRTPPPRSDTASRISSRTFGYAGCERSDSDRMLRGDREVARSDGGRSGGGARLLQPDH